MAVAVAAYSETLWPPLYQPRHWAPLTLSEERGHPLHVLFKGGHCLEPVAAWGGEGTTPGERERESKIFQASGMS